MKAEIGDKADFKLLDGERLFGDILHIPQATGDSWVVDTYDQGKKMGVFYVQQFAWMRLQKQALKEDTQ